jgi:hypothetical protein
MQTQPQTLPWFCTCAAVPLEHRFFVRAVSVLTLAALPHTPLTGWVVAARADAVTASKAKMTAAKVRFIGSPYFCASPSAGVIDSQSSRTAASLLAAVPRCFQLKGAIAENCVVTQR